MLYYFLIIRVISDCCFFFFFKQKTAYDMRISDWSSDVCSSDLSIWPSRNRGPALPTALCGMTPVYFAGVQQRSSINRLRIQNFAKPLQRSQDHSLLPGGQRDNANPELHLQQVGRCFQHISS